MRILAIITGDYGQRHVDNIRIRGPESWRVEVWQAPTALPLIVDYPEDFVPAALPPSDLILALQEHKGVAELIPEVAQATGAQAVIAPIDNLAWLPTGLANQLRGWLAQIGVVAVFPKPFCSLTETHFNVRRHRQAYENPLIAEFAHHFGKPELDLVIDAESRTITRARVLRDACCGCAHFVAEKLVGVSADEAEERAGLAHHHYPCLASMVKDPDFHDTLMHVSGNLLKDNVAEQVKPHKQVVMIRPAGRSE
jgi:thymidylate synthase